MTLLERGPVLDRLSELLDRARAGSGEVVIVHGEAGIGKTSVVRAFARCHESGAHILWAGCDDLLATRPLGPVWDVAADEPQLKAALESDDRLAVFRGVLDLLERALRPTVLVIEDVHWADDASLDLIKYVGRRIDRTHGLLVLTYRDTDLTTEHPLRGVLGDLLQEHLERLQLVSLSQEAVGQLVEDETRIEHIWKISGGNPFFVTELAGSDSDAVPESIKDSIRTRWSRLSPPARDLVRLVSVAPSRLRIAVIQHILGGAADLIAECAGSGILEVLGEALRFRHELARRAIEGDLDEVQRRELNRAVLEASESLGEELSRCAHHARQAKDEEAMLRLLPEAARQASGLESHRESLSHLRALQPYLDRMSPRPLADHYRLWASEQLVENAAAADELAETAVAQSRLVNDPTVLGRALLLASRIKWTNTRRPDAASLAEEAVSVLNGVGGEALAEAYAELSRLAMLAYDYDETRRWGDLALAQAAEGPSIVRANVLINLGSILSVTRFPEGIAELEKAYEMGTSLRSVEIMGRAAMNLASVALSWRRLDVAEPWIHLGLDLSVDQEWASIRSWNVGLLARLEEMRGDWAEAEATTRGAHDRSSGVTIPELQVTTARARLLVRQGSPVAADLVADTWRWATETHELQYIAETASIVAEQTWLNSEQLEDEILQDLKALLRKVIALGLGWYGGDLAQYLALLGAIDEVPAALPSPYVALDRGDWAEAAGFWEERGLPYEQAVALSRGDVDAQTRALVLLNDLGAKPLAARIRRELENEGLQGIPRGPHTATREHPLGLTPRQTEVLRLLNEDHTNEEIANELFVSIRTVENHVSAILTKLDVHDRSEAVELAREARVFS